MVAGYTGILITGADPAYPQRVIGNAVYDLSNIYDAAGYQIKSSYAGGTTADQTSWTNTGASAVNVNVLVWRTSSTRTTYQLRVSY